MVPGTLPGWEMIIYTRLPSLVLYQEGQPSLVLYWEGWVSWNFGLGIKGPNKYGMNIYIIIVEINLKYCLRQAETVGKFVVAFYFLSLRVIKFIEA